MRRRTPFGPSSRQRDQLTEVSIAETLLRKQHQARELCTAAGLEQDLTADDEVQSALARLQVPPHHASDRTFVCDRQRRVELGRGPPHQFFGLRGAHEEGEAGTAMQFGKRRRVERHTVYLYSHLNTTQVLFFRFPVPTIESRTALRSGAARPAGASGGLPRPLWMALSYEAGRAVRRQRGNLVRTQRPAFAEATPDDAAVDAKGCPVIAEAGGLAT